jgi:hypothetical protein
LSRGVIDHLVYATPELQATVADLRSKGIELVEGGSHVGIGTRNFLTGLGGEIYLEVIGPDPEQDEPPAPRPFGIDDLDEAKLVTWAERVEGLEGQGSVAMTRMRPDGVLLEWTIALQEDGPFQIDWKDSPHPTESLPSSCTLRSFDTDRRIAVIDTPTGVVVLT